MDLKLRRVREEDSEILFKWTNDPTVRKNAFNTKPVEWEEHQKWFASKLGNSNSKVYLMLKREEPVGQIRFDRENDYWKLSYSIAREYRGQGLGTELVKLGLEEVRGKVKAWVKKDNPASLKVFDSLGFGRENNGEEDSVQFVWPLEQEH